MASYQQIDTRLAVMEDMLRFVMTHFKMKAVVSSGLAGPDGAPLPGKSFEGSLLDFYLLAKAEDLPVVNQADAPAPPIENVN